MANKKDPNFKFYNNGKRPPTEIKLFELQEKYLETRDPEVWREMFEICHLYARSMVLKKITGKRFLAPEIVSDHATGAALAFMIQYKTNEDFVVGGSFAGMLNWKVIEALYKDYKEDNHSSFDDVVAENQTLEDKQEQAGFNNVLINYEDYGNPEEFLNTKVSEEVITEVLKDLEDNMGMDIHTTLLAYFYIIICLRQPKNRHSKNMFLKQYTDFKSNQILELTLLEIRNRLKGTL